MDESLAAQKHSNTSNLPIEIDEEGSRHGSASKTEENKSFMFASCIFVCNKHTCILVRTGRTIDERRSELQIQFLVHI